MSSDTITVKAEPLTRFATQILAAGGVAEDAAATWADVLVWANLRGMDSHGVLRLPRYIEAMRIGEIKPQPDLKVEKRSGAIAMIDADWAPGPVAMTLAMDEAIGRARETHIGWCTVRNITHAGAVGYFALQAAKQGFAGIVMTASRPMMAYVGARVPAASTNPLAIAVPGGDHEPLMLDMSTAMAAMGKILAARDSGTPIPEGWGMDAAGHVTTDADQVTTLMPLGGAKGAGLSIMIECLASLMVANPLIAPNVTPGATPTGYRQNGIAIAVDIAAFTDTSDYGANIDALAAGLKQLPKAEGVDEIYAPGERGDGILNARLAAGVPLPHGTWSRLQAIAEELSIAMPEAG